jgi:hypothetical protein
MSGAQAVRPGAAILDRSETRTRKESLSASVDWESPAGGPTALPRIRRLSFTYLGKEDDHLCGQACLALETPEPAAEECAVAFACGCRFSVLRTLLQPRWAGDYRHS